MADYEGLNAPYVRLAYDDANGLPVPVSAAYPVPTGGPQAKSFTMNLNQNAGTYDLLTVSGGNIDIVGIEFYNDVAAAGLTSVSAATNDTTPTTVLATTNLAALTGGKNLTAFSTPTILGTGKKIQYTVVGNGSAGSIQVMVRYLSMTPGAAPS